jgi:hypothetical protein
MSFLGFDALGRLALGQIGQKRPPTFVGGGAWEGAVRKTGLSAAIIATTVTGFVPPPQTAVAAPPVGGCFSSFSQPAPIAKVPAYLQPQPSYQVGYRGPANLSGPLVFSTYSQPRFSCFPAYLQPQPSYQVGYRGPANTSGPLVFSTYSQPRFSTSVKTHLQPQPSYQVGYRGPANLSGPLVFSKFERVPPATSRLPAHLQPQPSYQVGYRGPANLSGPLVFSKFEGVPPATNRVFAYLQPQPANRTYFYTFYDDAEVIQVLQELRVSYSDPRDFFSVPEIAVVPEETRIASLFQEDRVLMVGPKEVVETDAEFRLGGLPNRLRIK